MGCQEEESLFIIVPSFKKPSLKHYIILHIILPFLFFTNEIWTSYIIIDYISPYLTNYMRGKNPAVGGTSTLAQSKTTEHPLPYSLFAENAKYLADIINQ